MNNKRYVYFKYSDETLKKIAHSQLKKMMDLYLADNWCLAQIQSQKMNDILEELRQRSIDRRNAE